MHTWSQHSSLYSSDRYSASNPQAVCVVAKTWHAITRSLPLNLLTYKLLWNNPTPPPPQNLFKIKAAKLLLLFLEGDLQHRHQCNDSSTPGVSLPLSPCKLSKNKPDVIVFAYSCKNQQDSSHSQSRCRKIPLPVFVLALKVLFIRKDAASGGVRRQ